MPGVTKRKFAGEQMRFNKKLNRPLKSIKDILPQEYTEKDIINEFRLYYPLIWKELNEKYIHFKKKDEFLVSKGKKRRYNHPSPYNYIARLPQVKLWLSKGAKKSHLENFNLERNEKLKAELVYKKNKTLNKHKIKVAEKTEVMQFVDPLFIDAFIASYHKRGITTEQKIEVFNELKKYNTEKACDFFYKLNDAERNDQVRKMAFDHLQSLGIYVKLRKKFKGKTKDYAKEKLNFNMTPEDLCDRISQNSIQNKKRYDFFISHSLLDRDYVIKAKNALNIQGYRIYCDWTNDDDFLKRNLVSDYTKIVLKKRMEQSESLILLKSQKSLESEWVAFELEYFESLNKNIYYIDLDNEKDNRLKRYINLKHDIDNEKIENIKEVEI